MPLTRWIVVGAGLASIVLLVLFSINPIVFAGDLGTGAVLALAGASWIFWGSALVYLAGRSRLPILTCIALLIALFSLSNDNDDIGTASTTQEAPAKLKDALEAWHNHFPPNPNAPPASRPLFIVTAEGGGIRAAYWTAAVLGSIQDAEPSFAD